MTAFRAIALIFVSGRGVRCIAGAPGTAASDRVHLNACIDKLKSDQNGPEVMQDGTSPLLKCDYLKTLCPDCGVQVFKVRSFSIIVQA